MTNVLCLSLSHVWLFAAPWTVAHQAPLSMGILQARILEWVAMPSSRGSSQPRDWTQGQREKHAQQYGTVYRNHQRAVGLVGQHRKGERVRKNRPERQRHQVTNRLIFLRTRTLDFGLLQREVVRRFLNKAIGWPDFLFRTQIMAGMSQDWREKKQVTDYCKKLGYWGQGAVRWQHCG